MALQDMERNATSKDSMTADPPSHGNAGNDDPGSAVLPADLNKLIARRVADAVEAKTLALSSRVEGLQRKNKSLLLSCASLESTVQDLQKKGNWEYSAPDVPRSYWVEQGRDEEYADDAALLIKSIEERTRDLRSAGGCDDVKADWVGVECEDHVLSDNALHPHWEQLANAMQLSQRIAGLGFCRAQLNGDTLQMIEASVRQKGIVEFGLFCN